MTKKTCLYVYRYPNAWGPTLLENEECEEFLRLAVELGLAAQPASGMHISPDIQAPAEDPGWPTLLKALEKLGWKAHPGPPPEALKSNHFSLRTVVTYDNADLDASAYLRVADAWGRSVLTSFHSRVGPRWVGMAENVGRRSRLGWRLSYGTVDGWRNYFVDDQIKEGFEKRGLDLTYHPLLWDKPELAERDYWEVDTPHVMPSCLVPLMVDELGALHFNDGGCEPPELKYPRTEVEAMGPFDAAWSKEMLGNPNEAREGGRSLIVSQRFRKACMELGLNDVRFFPVRLIDTVCT